MNWMLEAQRAIYYLMSVSTEKRSAATAPTDPPGPAFRKPRVISPPWEAVGCREWLFLTKTVPVVSSHKVTQVTTPLFVFRWIFCIHRPCKSPKINIR